VTLFPDHGKYEEWKKKASEIGLKCAISIEAEKWFEEGLIGKGEAIDDYYLYLNKEVKNIKPQPSVNASIESTVTTYFSLDSI
jgi:hypothetical protein